MREPRRIAWSGGSWRRRALRRFRKAAVGWFWIFIRPRIQLVLFYSKEIHFSTYLFGPGQHLQQGDQLEKQLGIEPLRRKPEGVGQWWIGPVGPFARDTEAAAFQLAEDQRVDTRYASFLEYFEALAAQRVERMEDFSPSQRRTGLKVQFAL